MRTPCSDGARCSPLRTRMPALTCGASPRSSPLPSLSALPLSPPSLLSPSPVRAEQTQYRVRNRETPDLPSVKSRNLVTRSYRPSHVAYLSILPDSSSCIAEERSGGENVERDEDQRRPRRLGRRRRGVCRSRCFLPDLGKVFSIGGTLFLLHTEILLLFDII